MATNQMSTMTRGVETIIGYNFSDPLILWEALQAAGSGVTSAGIRRFPDGNKRLAVLGDTILKLVLVGHWYDSAGVRGIVGMIRWYFRASDVTLGRASDIVSSVGSNTNLDRVGRLHGLDTYVSRNPSQGHYISPATMSATVEAILGGVYIDGGIDNASQVMQLLGLVAP